MGRGWTRPAAICAVFGAAMDRSAARLAVRAGLLAGGAAALAPGHIAAGGDDQGGAGPGPQIGQITEDQIAKRRRADQLDIAERGDDRGRAALKGADDQIMPAAAQ